MGLASFQAHAFGPKRPAAPKEPADSQAYPTRDISFGKFLSTPFMLPDGKTKVDMSVVLPDLALTELTQSQKRLRARNTAPSEGSGEPEDRYILKGGLTAFEANNFSSQITIGYKPGAGDIGNGSLTGVQGAVKFNVGTLEMDFHLVDTRRQEVVAVGHGSALTGGVGLDVEIDFSVIKTGADFVYNSPMAPHFRKAVRDAFLQMANDPNTNFLVDWTAKVTRIDQALKQLFFDAGGRDQVVPGNLFTIYDSGDARLGEVKVQSAEHEQSAAAF
ncbi:MAG: hypothetical protein HY075_13120, partial [Deltaproteobacteria bacterium]|nr:hypothetical protein [Deltaproteobacteria bacterium]